MTRNARSAGGSKMAEPVSDALPAGLIELAIAWTRA
jgi:hypothetical protein